MRLVQFLLLTCALGFASTLTNTGFGANDPNVIIPANALSFDTQSISLSVLPGNQVQVVIDLDYDNGGATINNYGVPNVNQNLEPFGYLNGSISLATGDLFFYDPSVPLTQSCANNNAGYCVPAAQNSSLQYAVVLDGGNGLTTGALYQIGAGTGDVSLENASTALGRNASGDTFRPQQTVLVTANAGPLTDWSGTERICDAATDKGCVANGAQYAITLTFNAPAAFISALTDGQLGVEFSAADCGNAVLAGNPTPEPGTLGTIAAGLGMVGFGLARRRRKN